MNLSIEKIQIAHGSIENESKTNTGNAYVSITREKT